MLMMPDLFHWLLSGNISHECTIASTTQLFNPTTRQWAWPLIDALDLPRRLFGPITEPARRLGPLRASVRDATGLADVDVVLPAAHDTASAVAAVPAMPDVSRGATWCYISSGTWSLMGVELAEPMITDEVARRNFTNEVGLGGTIRLLKNIAGLWLVQQCRAAWAREGNRLNWGDLAKAAAEAPAWQSIFDPDDPALIAPHHMPDAIVDCCRRVGERAPRGVGPTIRAALESLALRYRVVLESLEQLTGQSITTIHVVGGGSRHELLCQMTADACQRVLVAGPSEATALGNIVAQAIAAGVVPSVQDARRWLAKRCRLREFRPQPNEGWDRALARFRAVT
jgi:rhamnulokinase